ncbi:MAG TPA: hypothetical protein VGH40_15405 [Roseiarcus sp.]|jgi:hypothetical protein
MNAALPSYLRDTALRVSRHEMGHYVIARLLGFRTGDVSIQIDGPSAHRGEASLTLPQRLSSLEDVQLYLRKRMAVLCAGALAETLPPRQSPKENKVDLEEAKQIFATEGKGAEQDFAKYRELVHLLCNIQHGREADGVDVDSVAQERIDSTTDDVWRYAIQLVNDNADLINDLAANLANRVKNIKERAVLTAADLDNIKAVRELGVM